MHRQGRRALHRGDAVLHRLLHLLEGAHLDLAHALAGLAEEFGVSRERVRQIEVSAFAKVQNAVKRRVAAIATPEPLQVR